MSAYWKDVAERVTATFVEAFAGVAAVNLGNGLTLKEASIAAAVAGVIAALSLAKSIAASFIGDSDSASLIE